MGITQIARAKINLTLKVLGRRKDGYHEIESLVTFAEVGDRLCLRPAEPVAVLARGPFAAGIEGLNLLEVAIGLLRQRDNDLRLGSVELEKNLPVAAGLGGGSSDAGALLRLVRAANPDRALGTLLGDVARCLGADVPVCFADRPALIRGIGDALHPLPPTTVQLPPLPAVLVNPLEPLATRRVFEALRAAPAPAAQRAAAVPSFGSLQSLLDYVAGVGNDLEPPAVACAPVIADIKAALLAREGCLLAAMSGSGPTCFGIFTAEDCAAAAVAALRASRPGWWIVATHLEGLTGAA
jgi:4-diphosphocytidyl-2-C-methyl-D-erythritol kinase